MFVLECAGEAVGGARLNRHLQFSSAEGSHLPAQLQLVVRGRTGRTRVGQRGGASGSDPGRMWGRAPLLDRARFVCSTSTIFSGVFRSWPETTMRTIALLLSLLGHTHAHAAPSLHRPFVAKPATTTLSTNRGPQLRLPPLSTTLAYTGLATTLAGASIATNAALGASAAAIVAGSMAVPAVSLIGQVYFMGGGARIAKMMGGVPADARLHAMACLLYTSPSPRDGLLPRMPSSA